jgi:hypothetical protein
VAADVGRSRDFYTGVLGGKVVLYYMRDPDGHLIESAGRPACHLSQGCDVHSTKVNLVASLGNDDHAITRRGCSAPGSE